MRVKGHYKTSQKKQKINSQLKFFKLSNDFSIFIIIMKIQMQPLYIFLLITVVTSIQLRNIDH